MELKFWGTAAQHHFLPHFQENSRAGATGIAVPPISSLQLQMLLAGTAWAERDLTTRSQILNGRELQLNYRNIQHLLYPCQQALRMSSSLQDPKGRWNPLNWYNRMYLPMQCTLPKLVEIHLYWSWEHQKRTRLTQKSRAVDSCRSSKWTRVCFHKIVQLCTKWTNEKYQAGTWKWVLCPSQAFSHSCTWTEWSHIFNSNMNIST